MTAHEKGQNPGRGVLVGCSCLEEKKGGLLPAADKAAVPSYLSSGTEVEFFKEISEHPHAISRAGAGSPGCIVH